MKILVILGPTASGKSALAIDIAKKINGEIISADSRQVYKGMDIGTGKVTLKEMDGIPHHLLDIVSPTSDKRFSVADWKEMAEREIKSISKNNKIPIICGGTGFYIQSIVDNIVLPEVPIDNTLREELEKKSTEELLEEISTMDRERAMDLDPQNRRRIIRAIEIARFMGKVPKIESSPNPQYQFLQIGIETDDKILREKIEKRLLERIDLGMIEEAERLHKNGLSFERMDELGLEYKYLAKLIQGELTRDQFIKILGEKIWQYSRRQKTWFKRDDRIKWFRLSNDEDKGRIWEEIENFLIS